MLQTVASDEEGGGRSGIRELMDAQLAMSWDSL